MISSTDYNKQAGNIGDDEAGDESDDASEVVEPGESKLFNVSKISKPSRIKN